MLLLRICLILAFLSATASALAAEECRPFEASLRGLKDKKLDPEQRGRHAFCLARNHIERTEAAQALLSVVRDSSEDTLLREDVIQAFAEAPLRKRVKLEGKLAPEIGKQEKTAVERTVASAGDLLALTQAVKSMDEIVPATRFEGDFVRALVEISLDEKNHVLLRTHAIEALERVARIAVESGVYDAKSLRLTHDTLKTLAYADDSGYYNGALFAYARVEKEPELMAAMNRVPSGRMISSQGPAVPAVPAAK